MRKVAADEIINATKIRDFELDDDDVIVGVLVMVKVVDSEDRSGVAMTHDGVDWINRLGMLTHILDAERRNTMPEED